MNIAEIWLPGIGFMLLGGFAVGALYGGNRIHAIWYGFFGVVCLLLLIALQLQQAVKKAETKIGEATPSPDRAWVSIDVASHSGITWDERGARFTVQFTLKNTGKTPAKNVFFEAKTLLPLIGGTAIPLQAMKDYAEDIQHRRETAEAAGVVIFPDTAYQTSMGLLVERKEAVDLLAAAKITDIFPRVIACASYSVEGVGEFRKTCTSYYVITPNYGGPAGTFRGVSIDMNYTAQQVGITSAFYSLAD